MTSGPGDRPRLALAVLCGLATWGVYFSLVWPRMLFERTDGVYAGMRTVWGDWALHFAYAGVFA